LWVTCISSGNECRLTHVHKGESDVKLSVCTLEYVHMLWVICIGAYPPFSPLSQTQFS